MGPASRALPLFQTATGVVPRCTSNTRKQERDSNSLKYIRYFRFFQRRYVWRKWKNHSSNIKFLHAILSFILRISLLSSADFILCVPLVETEQVRMKLRIFIIPLSFETLIEWKNLSHCKVYCHRLPVHRSFINKIIKRNSYPRV